MKRIFFLSLLLVPILLGAQKVTYDLVIHTPPKSWVKSVKANTYTCYTNNNTQKKEYCQIYIMASINSKGGIKEDFENEWQTLVATQYSGTNTPQTTEEPEKNGWKAMTGLSSFTSNKTQGVAMLTTMTGHNKAASVLVLTNSQAYNNAISQFMASIEMKKPVANNQNSQPIITPVTNSKYAFTTTNFDDGWKATEQTDWVNATKGNTVVLVHYAQPDIRSFNNLDESTAYVWNTIIAPRYSSIANLWIRKSWWADGGFMDAKYYAEADLTDKSTGKKVFVALFRNGNGGKWIEIICPSKSSFQSQFGIVYQQDGTNWNNLAVLANLNKFAVAASDLPGKWESASGAGIQYFNVYTGNSMGMATASSTTSFTFNANGTYTSVYKGVDGIGGANRYHGVTYNGKSIVSNWEIKLTNRFNGNTETFAAQFEAVKGGRILHMYRGSIEELHLFKLK